MCFLIYRVHQPVSLAADGIYDDGWFANAAQSILAGDWMGDFNEMTLIKGPVFAYFLVANHILGLPSTMTLALIYLGACWSLSLVLRRYLSIPRWIDATLFVLLLLQPAVVPGGVVRDDLYFSLFLYVVALSIAFALEEAPRRLLVFGALAGLAVGLLWMTREEGVWIVPGVLLLLCAGAWRAKRRGTLTRTTALAYVVFLVVAMVPDLATAAMNKHVYGSFVAVDFKASQYESAMKALDSIQVGPERRHVPVSFAALDAAYEVSPAAADLKPYFDTSDWGSGTSCVSDKITCGDIGGGWFSWSLRAAAAAAGHYRSEPAAQAYFGRVAREIEAACSDGRLHCRSNPIPLLPVISGADVRAFPASFWNAMKMSMNQSPLALPGWSWSDPAHVRADAALLNHPLTTPLQPAGVTHAPVTTHWMKMRIELGHVYRALSPAVLTLGALSFLLAVVMRVRRAPVPVMLLATATACWVFYLCRVGLVAMVDASSFPAINNNYLEPAFVALYVASFVSMAAAWSALGSRDRARPSIRKSEDPRP